MVDRNIDINNEILKVQIKLNEKAMNEIDALKEERIKLMAATYKAMKEKEMLNAKLAQTTAQLEKMAKKVTKNPTIKNNENVDPNSKSANAIE